MYRLRQQQDTVVKEIMFRVLLKEKMVQKQVESGITTTKLSKVQLRLQWFWWTVHNIQRQLCTHFHFSQYGHGQITSRVLVFWSVMTFLPTNCVHPASVLWKYSRHTVLGALDNAFPSAYSFLFLTKTIEPQYLWSIYYDHAIIWVCTIYQYNKVCIFHDPHAC